MILDIVIKNFRSFLEESVFSMEAINTLSKENNVIDVEGVGRVLKMGLIFGPNASGKTNLTTILYIIRSFVYGGVADSNMRKVDVYSPFMLKNNVTKEPTMCELRFVIGSSVFKYHLEVGPKYVEYEWLSKELANDEVFLVKRVVDEKGKTYITFHPDYKHFESQLSIPEYNQSILTPFRFMNGDEITAAAKYICNIQFDDIYTYPSTDIDDRAAYVQKWLNGDKNRKEKLLEFFRSAGVDVVDIGCRKMPNSERLRILFTHNVYDENHRITGTKSFPYEAESTGTMHILFFALRAIVAFENGVPLISDEFNEGLHTQASQKLLEMFRLQETNPKNAQLIATTHDLYLMDEAKLRRDQIWFIDKNEEGISDLYSLVEFSDTTENTPFAKWYLANRFNATPNSRKR